jgi:hypothetical protein
MAAAIRSDLTKHRDGLLKALAAGGKLQMAEEDAWPTIESVIRRYRRRMSAAQKYKEKRRSKDKLDQIAKAISKVSGIINRMEKRELKWICHELGKNDGVDARHARDQGSIILNTYLASSDNIVQSAKTALTPLKRKKNNLRSATRRLINELDDLWQETYSVSALKPGKSKKERQHFEKFAIMAINCSLGDNISNYIFNESLKLARKAHSEDSETSDQMIL